METVGGLLGHPKRKEAFATYVLGLFSSLKRKTVEGIAAQAQPDVSQVDAEHQRLLHIVGQSKWDDGALRRFAARCASKEMVSVGGVDSWIIDDTGFMKKGRHSVAVQRQYSGTAGKVENCQLAVSLVLANDHVQYASDFELYLPESWLQDRERCDAAKIPKDRVFQTKQELALQLIDRALQDDVPLPKAVLADSFYGGSSEFRAGLRARRLHYAVSVRSDIQIQRVDKHGFRKGPATAAETMAKKLPFRKVCFGNGSYAHFSFVRVVPTTDFQHHAAPKPVWLIAEAPAHEEGLKFHLCSLPPSTTRKELVRLLHQRFRTERAYQELKQEFGLDHYEGRSFLGWHHHVTAVLVCHAFTIAEQCRLFPPVQWRHRTRASHQDENASPAAPAPFDRYGAHRDRARIQGVAASTML